MNYDEPVNLTKVKVCETIRSLKHTDNNTAPELTCNGHKTAVKRYCSRIRVQDNSVQK